MATAWRDRFVPLSQVNSGNELEDGDTATGEHITIALENGAYAKKKADENANDISTINGNINTINGDITSIEQRLTNLGFKYPSAYQSLYLLVGGVGIGQITVKSGSASNLEGTSRQGNRAILDLLINLNNGSSTGISDFYSGSSATTSTAISEIYRPTQNQYIYVPSAKITYRQTVAGGTTYTVQLCVPIRVTLKTDGTFELQVVSNFRPSFQLPTSFYGADSLYNFSFKMGYQVNPISS